VEETGGAPAFGELLRRHRLAAGLTQEALAERAVVSVRAISDLERGVKQRPRRDTLRLLADALGLAARDRAALAAAAGPRPRTEPGGRSSGVFGSLPRMATPLVGRDADSAEVAALLLRADVPLVTLTGPGGVGKTRLALRVAADLAPTFADGAAFVDLAPVTDPALVLPTIGAALGVREGGRPVAEALRAFLRQKALLLVLDNLEQVVAAAPLLADLVAEGPRLTLLATSRVRLRLAGEHVYPVSPLALPRAQDDAATSVADSPAVGLFVARAAAAGGGFDLTAANAPIVAEIVRRLDGLPLAIELAAARANVLPPAALLASLGRRLPLLTGGPSDAPARQQRMRDAIAWSYDLLGPDAQALFRRLAVFAGGFDPRAAEAVAVDPVPAWFPDSIGRWPVTVVPHQPATALLDGLAALVDHGLVRTLDGPGGEARFGMLETMREFGLERLAASGEERAVRDAHAAHLLARVQAVEALLWAPEPESLRWLAWHEAERDNVRAALAWLEGSGRAGAALCLAGKLRFPWEARGHLGEARAWLERLLAQDTDAAPGVRAKALVEAGALALRQGDVARARVLCEEARPLARGIGERIVAAEAEQHLGSVAALRGDYDAAEARLGEALALLRDVGDDLAVVQLIRLGMVAAVRGETGRARRWLEEGLAAAVAASNQMFVAWAQAYLGLVARLEGDAARAVALCGDAAALLRETRTGNFLRLVLPLLGGAYLAAGEPGRAALTYAEGLRMAWADGDRVGCAEGLEGLAAVGAAAWPRRAARLLAVAEGLRAGMGAPLPPVERGRYAAALAVIGAALGEAELAAERESARSTGLEEAVSEALALAEGPEAEGQDAGV
jgi:predicted ATPase/transcriptional regulator with XRE-family HTH domain